MTAPAPAPQDVQAGDTLTVRKHFHQALRERRYGITRIEWANERAVCAWGYPLDAQGRPYTRNRHAVPDRLVVPADYLVATQPALDADASVAALKADARAYSRARKRAPVGR